MNLQERIDDKGFVLCGEGYIFELERRGYVKAGAFVPEVVLDHPSAVEELYREYMWAGSDIILALTYYAHRDKLRRIGREESVEELNRQAIRLAKNVAKDCDVLVAGDLCNTWVYDPTDKDGSAKVVRSMYEEQVQWAVDEGVDVILAETLNHMAEAEIALDVCKNVGIPVVLNFIALHDTTEDGFKYPEACQSLSDQGAAAVGLNCGRGPETMLPLLEQIRSKVSGVVSALPVAYRTNSTQKTFLQLKRSDCPLGFPVELEPFLLTRYEMAAFAKQAVEMDVRFVGVCCGGAPHHVRAMAEALGQTTAASRYSPDLEGHAIFGSENQVSSSVQSGFAKEREAFRDK